LAVNTFWHARWDTEQRKADDETSAGTNTMLVFPTEPNAPGLHEVPNLNGDKRIDVAKAG
jgi:hypothetical protein